MVFMVTGFRKSVIPTLSYITGLMITFYIISQTFHVESKNVSGVFTQTYGWGDFYSHVCFIYVCTNQNKTK